MVKKPRDSGIGWKYSVEPTHPEASYKFWTVWGPGLDNTVHCSDEGDANMIAAALNFATNFDKINREAKTLVDHLQYIMEFKVKEKNK